MLRFVYVPEDENSSKSLEMERVMREARLRELVKGVYSNSYGDSVTTKVIPQTVQQENAFLLTTFRRCSSKERRRKGPHL